MKDSSIQKNSKYTEDWIPVKDITDGCIITNNGTKVTGIKISPRNILKIVLLILSIIYYLEKKIMKKFKRN